MENRKISCALWIPSMRDWLEPSISESGMFEINEDVHNLIGVRRAAYTAYTLGIALRLKPDFLNNIDLIVLDLDNSEIADSLMLIRTIKELSQKTKVLAVSRSGNEANELMHCAMALGADIAIKPPFNPNQVVSAMTALF